MYYSKARKYVDSCSANQPPPPLARFVTSPIHDVQVIVDFTISTLIAYTYQKKKPPVKLRVLDDIKDLLVLVNC